MEPVTTHTHGAASAWHSREKRTRPGFWWRLLPLVLLVLAGAAVNWRVMGDDLASSYVGCRVLATGSPAALYSHDDQNFAGIADGDKAWPTQAAAGHYTGYMHPYVQTPLWALSLRPLCMGLPFRSFEHLFLLLALVSLASCLGLVARFWAPALDTPWALALAVLLLFFSIPFRYAMSLVQTHAPLLLLTLVGLMLAERRRPVLGALCVACAAAIKLTPGVLLLYWLAARRWRAAAWLLVWSAALLGLTCVLAGGPLFHAYLADLHRTSQVLLVSENNQSLAAWWMGHFFNPDEVFDVNAFHLPSYLRLLSLALMAAFAALGGWWDGLPQRPATTPLGAGLALTAMTIFAPIAWTHYYVVLAIPLMLLLQAASHLRGWRRWSLVTLAALAACPLFPPLAPDVLHMDLGDAAILRGDFFAGILVLAALLWAGFAEHAQQRSSRTQQQQPT